MSPLGQLGANEPASYWTMKLLIVVVISVVLPGVFREETEVARSVLVVLEVGVPRVV